MNPITEKSGKNILTQLVPNDQTEFDTPEDVLDSWINQFQIQKENLDEGSKGLRNPQVGAFYSILSHWTLSAEIGTVVLPTGTGKTETMLAAYVSEGLKKLLIIVPTDPLRKQISQKFLKLGLLNLLGLMGDEIKYPIVGIVNSKFDSVESANSFLQKSNVIVATASIMARMDLEVLDSFNTNCTHLFIDEAHHTEAKTWKKIRDSFKEKKIIQFTATPFRNDNKKIEGKIIYNYPLRKAQEEGYFKPINFVKIYEYSTPKMDSAIASRAVEQLRNDKQNYAHILLARVATQKRADEVFEIYSQYSDEFRVVKIHSGMKARPKREAHQKIVAKEVDIIVCVDMLGEGFDLPQLKIAAFHDIRKSLPITLQFVGRFTRTQHDEQLGNASIIVNLANVEVSNELDDLYSRDPDWNKLLPYLSESRTQQEIDLYNFVSGFQGNEDFPISIQSFKPALSTVVFKNHTTSWFPTNYEKGISPSQDFEVLRHTLNSEEKILVIVYATKIPTDWVDNDLISDLIWGFYVVYWETRNNLLFIHSSDNSSLHISLAKSIIGEQAELINGDNGGRIFRTLSGIQRFKLQNVGLTEIIGKLIRFVMRVGSDIEPALSRSQIQRAKKAMIFGSGYENGSPISIGCSFKGRIWSRRKNDISTFVKWCKHVGNKITNEDIDANEVLKAALVPKAVSECPQLYPFMIDWGKDIYSQSETKYSFVIQDSEYQLYNTDIILVNPSDRGNIRFGLKSQQTTFVELELEIFDSGRGYSDFRFNKVNPNIDVFVKYGTKTEKIEDYFYKDTPPIWFANGDYLEGNSYIQLQDSLNPFPKEDIIAWDWTGVDLSVESQGVGKIQNSIQFKTFELLKNNEFDYDVLFDDDDTGEIADIVAIKVLENKILIELYHLKFAIEGVTSRRIDNLYQVCGQAQKSVNWKFKKGKEFLEHLLRREALRIDRGASSRFEKGTKDDLIHIIDLVNNRVPLEFEISIVQPGISKANISENQLTLLGVVETYLMERALIKLKVIGSE